MGRWLQNSVYGMFGLALLVFIQLMLLSIPMAGIASHIQFPILEKLPLLQTLFAANFLSALQYLGKTPILVIEQLDIQSQQIWAYYLMPISLLAHIVVVWLLLNCYRQRACNVRIGLAVSLCLIAVMYVRVAACCTVNPSWILDTALLMMVYQPSNDTEFWQSLYLQLKPWLLSMQFVLVTAAILLLLNHLRGMKFLSK